MFYRLIFKILISNGHIRSHIRHRNHHIRTHHRCNQVHHFCQTWRGWELAGWCPGRYRCLVQSLVGSSRRIQGRTGTAPSASVRGDNTVLIILEWFIVYTMLTIGQKPSRLLKSVHTNHILFDLLKCVSSF